ncbi:hypothetical protein SLNHY_4603 [Streptomyces albus]|nr:hypothetical protein SLNHY_4603 [Streptomyces albus]
MIVRGDLEQDPVSVPLSRVRRHPPQKKRRLRPCVRTAPSPAM